MKEAYNKLAHVLRNNVPIIRKQIRDIEKRLLEIEEAFDGRTGTPDALSDDHSGPGDAEET